MSAQLRSGEVRSGQIRSDQLSASHQSLQSEVEGGRYLLKQSDLLLVALRAGGLLRQKRAVDLQALELLAFAVAIRFEDGLS